MPRLRERSSGTELGPPFACRCFSSSSSVAASAAGFLSASFISFLPADLSSAALVLIPLLFFAISEVS